MNKEWHYVSLPKKIMMQLMEINNKVQLISWKKNYCFLHRKWACQMYTVIVKWSKSEVFSGSLDGRKKLDELI